MGSMTMELTQKLRVDARHNRSHLVEVARAAFAQDGLGVPMREVARRADLGVATLYRHFPTRDDLIRAAFVDQVGACTAFVRAAGDDPDPWRGLTRVVDEVCRRQAFDHGFNAAVLGSAATAVLFAEERAQNQAVLIELVRRAQVHQMVRPDVTVEDLWLLLAATAAVGRASPDDTWVKVRRLATLVLGGMRARPGSALDRLPTRRAADPSQPSATS